MPPSTAAGKTTMQKLPFPRPKPIKYRSTLKPLGFRLSMDEGPTFLLAVQRAASTQSANASERRESMARSGVSSRRSGQRPIDLHSDGHEVIYPPGPAPAKGMTMIMPQDFVRRWKSGRLEKEFFLRRWVETPSLALWLHVLWDGERWAISPIRFSLRSYRGNHRCYCPGGLMTELRIDLFGIGFWCTLSRDPTRRPCSCDAAVWLMNRSEHTEEIEAYGVDRFNAEYPPDNQGSATR